MILGPSKNTTNAEVINAAPVLNVMYLKRLNMDMSEDSS